MPGRSIDMYRRTLYLILTVLVLNPPLRAQHAIRFDAYGSYLDVQSSPSLETPEFTVEFWLRVHDLGDPNLGDGEQNLLDKRDENGYGFNIRLAGTEFPVHAFGFVGPNAGVGADAAVVRGLWTHLAFTQSSDSLKVYVNSVLAGADSSRYDPVSSWHLRIGEFVGFPWAYLGLRGDMDELRIWDHARGPDSIAAYLHEDVSGYEPGLMAYWPFDTEADGWTPDLTANGNNAQMFGSARLVASDAPIGYKPLPAPTCVRAFGSETDITLAWQHGGDGISEYRVHRGDREDFTADETSLYATVAGTDSTFKDDSVIPANNYYYRIRAVDEGGHAGAQSEATLGRVYVRMDYLTGVYYNLSHDPADTTRDWAGAYVRALFDPPQPPMLGHYSSRDPSVVRQHLDWMDSYGIDFLTCEWWQADSPDDVTLRDFVLPEIETTSVRFSLQYLVNNFWGEAGLVIDDPIRQQMIADFEHMAETYFGHPNYLTVGGRPVVFIAASRHLQGDFLQAFADVRAAIDDRGFDVFLIGDEFRWGTTAPEHFQFLDAVGPYVMGTWRYRGQYLAQTEFFGDVSRWAGRWEAAAHPHAKYVVPSVTPGVNSRHSGGTVVTPRQILPGPSAMRTLEAQIRLLRPFVDPYLKMIMINSWNDWSADRQIEPTVVTDPADKDVSDTGSDYTLGFTYEGYGMKELEAIRALLAPELLVGVDAPSGRDSPQLVLMQNYPNPFTERTAIAFTIPRTTHVELTVYDVLGRRIRILENTALAAGTHIRHLDAAGLAAGVYYYELKAGHANVTRHMTYMGRR
jgi:hypothetical protein